MMKSRKMSWAGQVNTWERSGIYKEFRWESQKERNH
jgi:hypothetical protein